MRKSRQIINNVFFGFLVVSFFCAAAQSQQTASTAQPSREAAILARSFIVASLPEPSDAAATRPDSAAPSENAVTLTNPPLQGQSATTTSQGSSPSPFASSDDELHDKKWHYSATGYLWIPGIHGTVGGMARLWRQHPRERERDLHEFQGRTPGCVHTLLQSLLGPR